MVMTMLKVLLILTVLAIYLACCGMAVVFVGFNDKKMKALTFILAFVITPPLLVMIVLSGMFVTEVILDKNVKQKRIKDYGYKK